MRSPSFTAANQGETRLSSTEEMRLEQDAENCLLTETENRSTLH